MCVPHDWIFSVHLSGNGYGSYLEDSLFGCRRKFLGYRHSVVIAVIVEWLCRFHRRAVGYLAVLDVCTCGVGFHDQFAVSVDFEVLFVAVIIVVAIPSLTHIYVFGAFLCLFSSLFLSSGTKPSLILRSLRECRSGGELLQRGATTIRRLHRVIGDESRLF